MEYNYLKTRCEGASLWVEIHNPPGNFLTLDLLEELHGVFKQARRDDSLRVVILTGGREDSYIMHFAVHELAMLTTHLRRMMMPVIIRFQLTSALLKHYMTFTNWLMDRFAWVEPIVLWQAKLIRKFSSGIFLWYQMHRLHLAIENMNKVTVAAINGACNGGGTEISACFDFRFMVADQGFSIGQPEVLVSMVPGGGSTQRLPRLIGRAKALELMLRGNQLTPQEAKRIGLLTDVFDKKDFRQKVQEFADLMSKRPPIAIAAIKTAVLQGMDTTLRHGLSIELEQSVRCFDTQDTEMALRKYGAYIDENIRNRAAEYEAATTEELVKEANNTLDMMENARLFDAFTGR